MNEKNPTLMLFPIKKARGFSKRFLFVGVFLSKLLFSLKYDLKKANISIDAPRYCMAALVSAIIYGFIFGIIGISFGAVITKELGIVALAVAVSSGIGAFFLSFFLHLLYPKLVMQQIAQLVDQQLLFALRNMLLQLSSGMSLFETIKNVSRGGFGEVSEEFQEVIKDINAGMSETKALEKLAFSSESTFLKKAVWQIVTASKTGGSMVGALNVQIEALVNSQLESIKSYSAELNLWILIYLIVSAAMPSLGVTFLTILSTIGGSGIGKNMLMIIILVSILVQVGMIMMIRTRVPKVIR